MRQEQNLWASVMLDAVVCAMKGSKRDHKWLFENTLNRVGSFRWICEDVFDWEYRTFREALRLVFPLLVLDHGRITDFEIITQGRCTNRRNHS